MEHIFGTISMILSIALALIGLPKQIIKQHRDNRVGIDGWLIVLPFGIYASRATYGILIGSYYIMIPDIIGTIFSLVLLFQTLVHPRLALVTYAEKRNWL